MNRWIGLMGSWALLVLALGLAGFAVAGETINVRDERRLDRVAMIDQMIAERSGNKAAKLRTEAEQKTADVQKLQSRVKQMANMTDDLPDTGQKIIVSTAENKLYVRRNGQTVFETICSTGTGSRLAIDGETKVFNTPIGKFRILSKEENPVWIPPDWHYVEEARKRGMRVIRLGWGSRISKSSGEYVGKRSSGVWGWFGNYDPVIRVVNKNVVIDYGDYHQALPPGELIFAGGAVVIPPVGTPQRQFPDVLGTHRLNLGDGYALHGTQQVSKLGTAASHGCIRLANKDIAALYEMSSKGDEVIIY